MLKSFYSFPKWLGLIPAFFFIAQILFVKPSLVPRTDYLPPPNIVQHMAAGLKTQLADSFWLRAVQDFDFCDQPLNENECKGKSWLFQVLDLTTDLDQLFFHAYHWGGLALTIIISDYAGASVIFDKGVAQFPKDWMLSYAAAYHALFEEKNKVKASKLYFQAAENGAPNWVRLMAGRLAVEGGEKEFASQILSTMIEVSDDQRYISKLKSKLLSIQSEDQK